jgi:ABC-type sugar transport system permease subunit
METRQAIGAYMFISPFIIGFFLFFLYPFVQSIIFSLSELKVQTQGFVLRSVGLENYRYALMVHPSFVRQFTETLRKVVSDVPLILAFSLFMAVLLNQRFRGRTFARIVFFMPVIMGAGVILSLESSDYMMGILAETETDSSLFSVGDLRALFLQLKLPPGTMEYIVGAVNRIAEIIRASGIQILLFLAGLQSIPSSLYEAGHIEGSTAWEDFWLITFPLLTPVVLVATVYTVVDSFTSVSNPLLDMIKGTAFTAGGYGVSAAMSMLYFAAILIILGITIGLISRKVYYQE